jgi:cobalt-zinc-cadmium resistance protein CzcA
MDNAVGITQNMAWPGLYKNQKKWLQQQRVLSEREAQVTAAEVTQQVREGWYSYLLNRSTLNILKFQDSLYANFVKKAEVRVKTGETSMLELISARTKFQEVEALKLNAEVELKNSEMRLKQLLQINTPVLIAEGSLVLEMNMLTNQSGANPSVGVALQQVDVAKAKMAVEKAKTMPDLTFGYNHQLVISGFNPANISRTYTPGTRIAGWQIGLAIPVFNRAGRARVKAEALSVEAAAVHHQNVQSQLDLQYQQEYQHYETFKKLVAYYTATGLKQADEQSRIAQVSFNLGEIGYMEYIQHITQVIQTKLAYIEALSGLNQSAIQLLYLKGN